MIVDVHLLESFFPCYTGAMTKDDIKKQSKKSGQSEVVRGVARDNATGRFSPVKADIKPLKALAIPLKVPLRVRLKGTSYNVRIPEVAAVDADRLADEAIEDTFARFDWTLAELAK